MGQGGWAHPQEPRKELPTELSLNEEPTGLKDPGVEEVGIRIHQSLGVTKRTVKDLSGLQTVERCAHRGTALLLTCGPFLWGLEAAGAGTRGGCSTLAHGVRG